MGNRVVNRVPVKQGLYEISSTQKGDLGAVMEFEDGRKFVYCLAGEELTVGTFCQGPIEDASGYWEEMAIASDVAVGDRTITITTQSAITANQFKDGWLVMEDATADVQGTLRKIKSHPAAGSGASLVITVYDAFIIAATAGTDEVSLLKNPYNGVLENNSTTDGPLLGLPTRTVTTGYYFWLQVRGPAAIIGDEGSLVVGDQVCVDATAGTAMLMDTAGDAQLIGHMLASCDTSGNIGIVYLQIG